MYIIEPADIYYYWFNSQNAKEGGYYDFYEPFEGPDPVLMDGEFIELCRDITLTKDVKFVETCSFGDPIFAGGTFHLTFGENDIDLNGYKFILPAGVIVLTDKQTDIFSVSAADAENNLDVKEELNDDEGFPYRYVVKQYVIGGGEGVIDDGDDNE